MSTSNAESPINVLDNKTNNPHRTYLVTYSQLDHRKFPTRFSFGTAVVASFGGNNVDYFVASKEDHETGGYHYHCAVRLNKSMRWRSSKNYLKENYDINVNYSVSGDMYAGAYRYTVKTDKEHAYVGSVLMKHPNLDIISQTYNRALAANSTYCRNRQLEAEAAEPPAKVVKKAKMKKADVALFIIENNLRTELQLLSLATERRDLGDRTLYDYLISLRRGIRQELVQDAWTFEEAKSMIENEHINRVEMLQQKSQSQCLCEGKWLACAKDILLKNDILRKTFCDTVFKAIEKGRYKHLNILITGPVDCGKTFILNPVCDLFPDIFQNPASSTFGWLGVKKSNLIFLNDFRWSPRKKGGYIDWADLLKLLEGGHVTLPAPMNSNTQHIEVTKTMPIFATSSEEVHYWINHPDEPITDRHRIENAMMKSRWHVFEFTHQFKKAEKIDVPKCVSCFSRFILNEE